MYRYLITAVFLLFAGLATGQGWERVYPGGGQDEADAVAQTPDGGFVMTGYYGGSKMHLLKTDADGNLQWSKPVNNTGLIAFGKAIVVTPDTGYAICGTFVDLDNQRNIYLVKTDAFGNVQWTQTYGGPGNDEGAGLVQMPDGGFVLCGQNANDDALVLRTDAQGNLLWQHAFGENGKSEKANAITLAANGDIAITGELFENPRTFVYVLRLDSDGNMVWQNAFGILSVPTDRGRAIVTEPDGSFLIAGYTNAQITSPAGLLWRVNADGTPAWNKIFPSANLYGLVSDREGGFFASGSIENNGLDDLYVLHTDGNGVKIWDIAVGKGGPDGSYGLVATADGGVAAAGVTQTFVTPLGESSPYLVKVDAEGVVFTSYLQGNVYLDLNGNCQPDADEIGLEDWVLKVSSPNYSRYVAAGPDGNFTLLVDTGAYEVELYYPNNYWTSCNPIYTFQVPAFYDTVGLQIPVQAAATCPRNEVDVTTPVLRRCADNTYTVRYCNSGTMPSFNTEIVMDFGEQLQVTGSSIPWTNQQGQKYTFQVGTLNPGDCKFFTVNAFLQCNTEVGQTQCVNAHIYPDTFCNAGAGWDGSFIVAKAVCENDTVKLILERVGGTGGPATINFVIAEDILMLTDPATPLTDNLLPNQERVEFTTPANGKTYRIIASQIDNYPGISYPTAAVEGCGTDNSGGFSTGFYTMFPEDEADAFVASDCQEIEATDYDSIYFKRGHPKGYDASHYVSPETDLDFLIYFQNSGNDTVHQVIVRDTLSATLDPATVYPGAASHPYDFQVYGAGIVQFTIPNANLLPGSSGNAKDGFVSFRVSQKPDLECGTTIHNTAAIYFDFNAPVITNQTYHTSCPRDSFLIFTGTQNPFVPGATVKVYPNPFAESAQFEINGMNADVYGLEIYDSYGRLIFNQFYSNPTFRLLRHQIPSGAYVYRLVADGRPVASGKIIAQH